MSEQLSEQGASTYRAEMRSMTRALWTGAMSWEQAFELGMFNIRVGLTNAWHRGMESVGLRPVDISPEERVRLQQIITQETNQLAPFLDTIEANSKASGGKLGPLMDRAAMWANRFPDVENQARLMAQNDPVLEWQINVTRTVEQNCSTCLGLSGKPKRASAWRRAGLHPQRPPNEKLECGGWLCGCALVPSTKALSKGPLPRGQHT